MTTATIHTTETRQRISLASREMKTVTRYHVIDADGNEICVTTDKIIADKALAELHAAEASFAYWEAKS